VLVSTACFRAMSYMGLEPNRGGQAPKVGVTFSRVPHLEFFTPKRLAKILVTDFGLCKKVAKSAMTSNFFLVNPTKMTG
jgi:hypothetical protein